MQVQNCGAYSFNITKTVKHILITAIATSLEKLPSAAFFLHFSPCLPILFLCHLVNALPRSIASRPAFDRVSSHVRSRLVPRSVVPRPAFADKYRDCNKKPYLPPVLTRVAGRVFYSVNCFMNSSSLMMGMFSSCAFLFFEDIEAVSLLIRKLVDLLTLPVTFPPWLSM